MNLKIYSFPTDRDIDEKPSLDLRLYMILNKCFFENDRPPFCPLKSPLMSYHPSLIPKLISIFNRANIVQVFSFYIIRECVNNATNSVKILSISLDLTPLQVTRNIFIHHINILKQFRYYAGSQVSTHLYIPETDDTFTSRQIIKYLNFQ